MPKINVDNYLEKKYAELLEKTSNMSEKPYLATILVGDRKDSEVYVKNKEKSITKAGMLSGTIRIEDGAPVFNIATKIVELNKDPKVNGILLQLPLNREYYSKEDEDDLISLIHPSKDVDGLTSCNQANLFMGKKQSMFLTPCTPTGIVQLLKEHVSKYKENGLVGLDVTVVGRSQLLGNSLAQMLMRENANVTILHSKSFIQYPNALKSYLTFNNVDVICLCAGSADMLTAEDLKMIGHDVVVIDAAINVGEDGKLRGDLKKEDYSKIDEIEEFNIDYTSVPGGVGPITTFTLAYNLYKAYCLQNIIKM